MATNDLERLDAELRELSGTEFEDDGATMVACRLIDALSVARDAIHELERRVQKLETDARTHAEALAAFDRALSLSQEVET